MPGRTWRVLVILILGCMGSPARGAEVWFAPTDPVTQRPPDGSRYFYEADTWSHVSSRIRTFSVAINYLMRSPPAVIRRQLAMLKGFNIRLDVQIPMLPVDKNICGDGVEGMSWPGEPRNAVARLKALGADVDSFAFDLPITEGHLAKSKNACGFSIAETARRLALTVRDIRAAYPKAKLIDLEVPTGIGISEWRQTIAEWLEDFRSASGEDFYGLTMDVWWDFQWREVVVATAGMLHQRRIRAGVFIDSSEGGAVAPGPWIQHARRHLCDVESLRIPIDYFVVANWLDMQVANIDAPEGASLTDLANWAASDHSCTGVPD